MKILLLFFLCSVGWAWDSFTYFPPLKVPYHPVSTKSHLAQQAFDQGLLAIYAFNYDQAVSSFDRASQYDPDLAMAYWGMALALDENLDQFAKPNHAKLTYELAQKALSLAKKASAQEQAYIDALQKRFSPSSEADKNKLRVTYTEAMAGVVDRYPDDLDATTLYAEGLMDGLQWNLWTPEETPREGTLKIVALLQSVIKRDPDHVGANHYYIHALESSPIPERALIAAYHLDDLALAAWGHLLHTSSHIYMRVGDYERSVEVNLRAIDADTAYVAKHGLEGKYPLKYLAHNYFYLTSAYMWQERFDKALETAKVVRVLVEPYLKQAPQMEFNCLLPLQVYLYFNKWNEIIALPQEEGNGMLQPFHTFAVALAHAKLGNLGQARSGYALFQQQVSEYFAMRKLKADYPKQLFEIGDHLLLAAIAHIEKNSEQEITHLKGAIEIQEQDFGIYTWGYPITQSLGATLNELGRYSESEAIYRKLLNFFPRNGRSLFGLLQSLKHQDKPTYMVERECQDALRFADAQ